MAQAIEANTTNPSIGLTRKGERAVFEQTQARLDAVAEKRQLRIVAAREVELLLAFLDRLDGDPDLEPTGDELDVSYPAAGNMALRHPHEDDEPTMGWTDREARTGQHTHASADENEDSDPGEISDEPEEDTPGEDEPDDEDSHDTEQAAAPSAAYTKRLRARRPRRNATPGFYNVGDPVILLVRPW